MAVASGGEAGRAAWELLLRVRWLIGGAVALAFAVGQLAESALVGAPAGRRGLMLDVVGWGALGGLAVWLSLTWASRQERRYQAELEQGLAEQRRLNRQLQRANAQLALLSEANRRIAGSASLDDILDAAMALTARLAPSEAAALVLSDGRGPVVARSAGAALDELRSRMRPAPPAPEQRQARLDEGPDGRACLVLPLHDGVAAVGHLELYLGGARPQPDEVALLETIASEVAEAVVGARRRAREEGELYELERAVADERARISRDIHDGIAQSLAFRRMRVDLWLDWLESDPARLRGELVESKRALREEIGELRRAIFALRPVQFEELGFAGGLRRYVEEFAGQQGWRAEVDLGGLPPGLPPAAEAVCFRFVQEALTNAAKHAGAAAVAVRAEQADGGLRLAIRDDGRGFVPGLVEDGDGRRLGLRQLRERAAALRGRLTILSQPGAGAELRMWLPLGQGGATEDQR